MFSGFLDSELDLILLEAVLVLLSESLLLLCDVLFLLDCEFVQSLLVDGINSLFTVTSDEVNHGSEHLGSFFWVHLSLRYINII